MHLLFEDVLRFNRYLMGTWGVWPMPQNAGDAFKFSVYIRILLSTSSIVCLIVPQMFHIKSHWGDINILADTGCIMLVYTLLVFKYCYIIVRRKSFCKVYQHLREFWDVSDNEEERKSYEDFASIAKLIIIIAIFLASGTCMSFMAAALIPLIFNRHEEINETMYHRILPLDMSYGFIGFDTQKTPNFEMIFMWQTAGLIFCALGVVGSDGTMMTMVLHLSGQFRFICTRFQTIGQNVEVAINSNDEKAKHKFVKMIAECLAHHRLVIRVAKKVNDLQSPIVFGQMLISSVEICLSGYAVMEGESSGVDLIKFCVFLNSMMLQLFVWCWPGETLIQESNAVADTIWHDLPWFMLPVRLQRDLCFVILRAQKECNITTAFQVMSMQKLSEVLKAAGSYMTLLRTLKEK